MSSSLALRRGRAVSAFVILLALACAAAAQDGESRRKSAPRGTPVLWRAHPDPGSLDLFHGPGGRDMRPDPRGLTFIEEERGGYSTKYRVRDRAGREWVAKVGKEAQSETAASRLLWAAGYMTEITYLAPRAHIPGKGDFENVRFEARPSGVERHGDWKWEQNPFTGSREFQGLKVMMVLLNNWDIKDENNVRLSGRNPRTGQPELRYAISDLGATLGGTGGGPFWRITRSRNDPKDFSEDNFIDEVEDDGHVDFAFSGKKSGILNDITVEQARWVGGLLSRLSDRQIADAFRAANYTRSEVRILTAAVRERVDELVRLRRPRPSRRRR